MQSGTGAFGSLSVRLDPWDGDYGSGLGLSESADDSDLDPAQVDAHADVPVDAWTPVNPASDVVPFERVFFVDGIRRLERRVLLGDAEGSVHGAFGSLAVGAVEAWPGGVGWAREELRRVLIATAGRALRQPVSAGPALSYEPLGTDQRGPDAALARLQDEMRACEGRLAAELARQAGALVIGDGPLRFSASGQAALVGLVKRLVKLHLPAAPAQVLGRLAPGQRTPLFRLTPREGFARWSWFLRLDAARLAESELAGLVRLEVAEPATLDQARRLADCTALLLPRFAPSRARDPRAPQNLLPVGALELRLRRLLGDRHIVRRRLEHLIYREAAHV
jgi:hypothetical protein